MPGSEARGSTCIRRPTEATLVSGHYLHVVDLRQGRVRVSMVLSKGFYPKLRYGCEVHVIEEQAGVILMEAAGQASNLFSVLTV